MRFSIMLIFFIMISGAAKADCTSPAGIAGTMDYFGTPDNTYKFCNGTQWVRMGNEVPAPGTGWPDAIECLRNDGNGNNRFFLGNPNYLNEAIYVEPSRHTTIHFSLSTRNFTVCDVLDDPGSSGICLHLSTADCRNTSQGVDRLRTLGRAYSFARP